MTIAGIPDEWRPIQLSRVTPQALAPTLLYRGDGVALLYPGRVNSLIGESESGKTWLALFAAAQAARRGKVLYFDFEDSAAGLAERLLLFASPSILRNVWYVGPTDVERMPEALPILTARLKPVLAVVDGVTEAMALTGLDPLSNRDAADFNSALPVPLKSSGAAVLLIDHVGKATTRTDYAIGAQHKRAAVDGASYVVRSLQHFGRGIAGALAVDVAKDRLGWVRPQAVGRHVAVLRLVPVGDRLELTLTAPEPRLHMASPTDMRQAVLDHLARADAEGASGAQLRRSITGSNDRVDAAVHELVQDGQVIRAGSGPGSRYVLVELRS